MNYLNSASYNILSHKSPAKNPLTIILGSIGFIYKDNKLFVRLLCTGKHWKSK